MKLATQSCSPDQSPFPSRELQLERDLPRNLVDYAAIQDVSLRIQRFVHQGQRGVLCCLTLLRTSTLTMCHPLRLLTSLTLHVQSRDPGKALQDRVLAS